MKSFASHLLIIVIRIHSWFPLWYLLFYSKIFYILLYHIIGYRKNIVRQNLANAFPHKSKPELHKIETKYYHHLCDLMAENIWALRASPKKIKEHCEIVDLHVFEKLYNEKKDFVCLLGHIGNWEWCSLSYNSYHLNNLIALYRPIKSKAFDQFFLEFRSRLGSHLIPMQQLPRVIHEQHHSPVVLAFIADQSPVPEYAYWTQFLNQETCFFNGYDKVARKKGYPVVLAYLKKLKPSSYIMKVELLAEDSSTLQGNQLTELYVRRLEHIITENPEHWLWSHRRWKHKNPK